MAESPRRIVMLTFPGAQILDVAGPLEVFAATSKLLRRRGAPGVAYRVELVAAEKGPLPCSNGISMVAERSVSEVRGAIDTLLVAGGEGALAARHDERVLRFLRRQAGRARRIASICTGTFLLAEAGLLDGRRAATHWSAAEALAAQYPSIDVEADAIYVRDDKDGREIWSSAGVTAGMDLALALVEQDRGRAVALHVARWLVVFLRRPGGQSQFSAQLASQLAHRDPLREVQAHIAEHPEADLSVPELARRAAMSPRHFARVFGDEVGTTPARFVERTRVEAARVLLEESDDGVESVAARCGFGTAETMRRAFLRVVRVSPNDYRARFRRRTGGSSQSPATRSTR
jgi:transcriptional regulator GlxA family with amidase domain